MNRARWISASLLVAALGAAPHAFAQDNKAAAEALFDDAKKLMEAKRYGEACPKFADSQRMDPGVGTLLNLGLCYKQNGQTASAWSTYREAAAQARAAGQSDREQLARDEATALEPQLTKLVIEVPAATASIQGLEIKRDGALVPQGLWGVPAPVDPGTRGIDVTAPSKKPLHLEARTVGAGSTAKVVIPTLEDGPPPPPDAGGQGTSINVVPPPPPPDPSTGKGQRILGFVVGGAGILVGGVGTWFGLLSVAENKAADNTSSSSKKANYKSNSDAHRTIGFIGIGVGAAALISGIVIVVTAPSAPKTALTITPEVGENTAGLRLAGSF